MSFVNEIPINQVIEAEPEELAPSLLRYLKKQDNISRYTIISYTDAQGLPANHRGKYLQVLSEAWTWLEREGFIAPRLDDNQGSFVTPRACGSSMIRISKHTGSCPCFHRTSTQF